MMKDSGEGRFLITFDEGPHANTGLILEQLVHNPLQQATTRQHAVGRDETAGATMCCGVGDGRAELQTGKD